MPGYREVTKAGFIYINYKLYETFINTVCKQSFGLADADTNYFFAEACSLALANFYAGLSRVPDHRIPHYWLSTLLR
jgi:hypothetical protein